MTRRIFIGDIQGCCDELQRLLDACAYDPAEDELHPVGDLVNRGPDSLATLRLLRELDAGGVLGNHDLHLLRASAGTRRLRVNDTLKPVLEAEDHEELLGWLEARPFVRDFGDVILVHAALNPSWEDPADQLGGLDPLEPHPDSDFATRARYCDAKGKRPRADWPAPPEPFRPWFEFYEQRGEDAPLVVYGHWARMGLVSRERVRGLDSGCVWGGKLSAWIAEEDRVVQVEAASAYAEHADE